MKLAVLCLALLQSLSCSGFPLYQHDLAPTAQQAITMSLAQVNKQSTGANLYRVHHSSIKRVVTVGMNMYDLLLNFGIRETVCPKASGSDPNTCDFKLGFFVSTASCSSRVRVSSELSEIISLRCSRSTSSSSSSESNSREMSVSLLGMNGRNPFGNGGAAPAIPPAFSGPVQPDVPRRPTIDNRIQNFLE